MGNVDFKYGALIRGGPKTTTGGKWDAFLDEYVRNSTTNADLTIFIRLYFSKINPASGKTGLYGDTDDKPGHPSKRKIQRWATGEFERYTKRLVSGAQQFWNGKFWLQTPQRYDGLNWPDTNPTHRCNLYCRFELEQVFKEEDAHYTIAVVRAQDGETFRSDSRLYSQVDLNSESLIPGSTVKFWTHFHEVGHLLGMWHVGHGDTHNKKGDNSPTAYGVTKEEMEDVMGKGSVRHDWHALPWQEGAESFTGIPAKDWTVRQSHTWPSVLLKGAKAGSR